LISEKPYRLLWYFSPFILLISFFNLKHTIDIQQHDTYVVISALNIGLLFAVFSIFCGAIYWVLRNRKLYKWITNIHVLTIIIVPLFLLINVSLTQRFIESIDILNKRSVMDASKIILLIFLLSQILFLLNVLLSIFRKPLKITG